MKLKCITRVLSLLSVFLNAHAFAECPLLSAQVQSALKSNTFLYIPINIYASPMSPEVAQRYVKANCANKNLPLGEKLNCKVLEKCAGEDCVKSYADQGTAFLAGSGDALYTAWHVALQTSKAGLIFGGAFLKRQSRLELQKLLGSLKPEFVLVNQSGQIVYDTRIDQGTRYTVVGDIVPVMVSSGLIEPSSTFGYLESVPQDFAGIHLVRPIGSGLPISTDAPQIKDCIYSSSFFYNGVVSSSVITSGQKLEKVTDFKTRMLDLAPFLLKPLSMKRSSFEKLSIHTILKSFGYSDEQVNNQISRYDAALIRSSITTILDTQERHLRDLRFYDERVTLLSTQAMFPGGSGSPMLDLSGNVVGIVNQALIEFDSKHIPRVSHGAAGVSIRHALSQGIRP